MWDRLEAATSRLEDIAVASGGTAPLKKELAASSSTTTETPAPAPVAAPTAQDVPKSVTAYDAVILQAKLQPFVQLSNALGGPVQAQVSRHATSYYSN